MARRRWLDLFTWLTILASIGLSLWTWTLKTQPTVWAAPGITCRYDVEAHRYTCCLEEEPCVVLGRVPTDGTVLPKTRVRIYSRPADDTL